MNIRTLFRSLSPRPHSSSATRVSPIDAGDSGIWSYWERVSKRYDRSVPPGRPSVMCLDVYRSFLDKSPRAGTAIILGCTPDVRKIAAKHFQHVLVIDFSPSMLRESSRLLDAETLAREEHLVASWSEIENLCSKASADVVLGDSIFKQLDPTMLPKMLEGIAFALKPDGTFITRVRLQDRTRRPRPIADTMREYLADSRAGQRNAGMVFIYRLYDHIADEIGRVQPFNHWEEVHRLMQQFPPREYERLARLWRTIHPHPCTWSQVSEDLFTKVTAELFCIGDKRYATDYPDAGSFPLYLFRKKCNEHS